MVNDDLLSEFINRYFGSQLAQSSSLKSGRSLSTTEARINDRLVQLFGTALQTGWKEIANIELEKTTTEINPEFIKLGDKEELGVRFNLDITFNDFTGIIQWLLPYASIEPLSATSDKASTSIPEAQKTADWNTRLYDNIQEIHLDVQAVMSDFEMSLEEVKKFKVGTVLPLGNPGDVQLCIENIPVFTGEYGAHADKKAVSLQRRIELPGS